MDKNPQVVWNKVLSHVKDKVEPQPFQTWFTPIVPYSCEGSTLTIRVPNQVFYEWLEEHYIGLLRRAIQQELGAEGKLVYQIAESKEAREEERKSGPGKNIKQYNGLPLNSLYTFENFVVGDFNQLVQAAAVAVSEKPGQTAFNPLMIYSDVGLGKTHTLQAIAHRVKLAFPGKKIIYISAEEFTSQFIQNLRENKTQEFINFYLDMDVLLIDDVQFLGIGNKEKTQEIFFHIFNHLHQHGKQIVMTSDTRPSDLQGFEKRLLSRFKWGLTTDLKKPDLETRMAIIQKKLEHHQLTLASDIIRYIATAILTNIRELEGVITSLSAYSVLNKKQINLALVEEVLKKIVRHIEVDQEVTIEYLQKLVAAHYNISLETMNSGSKKRLNVLARHLAMYLARQHTQHTLEAIGRAFGRKDHSTVSYATQAVEDAMQLDQRFRKDVERLQELVKQRVMSGEA